MLPTPRTWLRAAAAVSLIAGFAPVAEAQTITKTFTFEDVWMLPDVSRPGTPAQQLTGSFEWTYDAGDFENGSGQIVQLYLPWYGTAFQDLTITFDLDSIEFSLVGNFHNLGVDVSMFLLTDFDPVQPAAVDTVRSKFYMEAGDDRGHFVGGSVVPEPGLSLAVRGNCPDLQFDVANASPNARVALVYAFGTGSFAIPNGFPCAGTVLGLDRTVALGAMLNADGNGAVTFSKNVPAGACGNVFLQALDLASCELSDVVPLQ
ncbi:MAG TPA: hypothetical protein VGC54_02525 [Planctomycetota bacterium]